MRERKKHKGREKKRNEKKADRKRERNGVKERHKEVQSILKTERMVSLKKKRKNIKCAIKQH